MYRVDIQVADELLRFFKEYYVPEKLLLTEPREICFRIKELMIRKNETLAGAESVTGGMISSMITDIPGSSNYFLGCAVVYSEGAKRRLLRVSQEIMTTYGVVSEKTVIEMAKNCKTVFNSGFSYATSGYAGPDGGDEASVGTIWFGFGLPDEKVVTWESVFKGDRLEVRRLASDFTVRALYTLALNFLGEEK